jgi:CRISPR system Cascade subunit CasD
MARHLILILEGPLAAYGTEMVDAHGPVHDWPGASLLTGLLANALGFSRGQREAHARLQARLEFAVRIDRVGVRLRDFQTAQLGHSDNGWTTRGVPEGRAGGAGTYQSPHIRERDYFSDLLLSVAIALREIDSSPTLDDLAAALAEPARPLFLGRKPCWPSRPIMGGFVDAADPLAAVLSAERRKVRWARIPALWSVSVPAFPNLGRGCSSPTSATGYRAFTRGNASSDGAPLRASYRRKARRDDAASVALRP